MELVDMRDLGSRTEMRAGSSPARRTKANKTADRSEGRSLVTSICGLLFSIKYHEFFRRYYSLKGLVTPTLAHDQIRTIIDCVAVFRFS